MMRFFCYGTLKSTEGAHRILAQFNPKLLGVVKTSNEYHLYDQGAFPGMIRNPEIAGNGVTGELHEVSEDCLPSMDRYEGVPSLFTREEITLEDGSKATAYLICRPGNKRIESGLWARNEKW